MNKKIVVPEGMLKAVAERFNICSEVDMDITKGYLSCALRWLSENPIVPTRSQLQSIADKYNRGRCYPESIDPYVIGFQCIMFIAEPEVPEEIRDLLIEIRNMDEAHGPAPVTSVVFNKSILDAFYRGQKSK